MDEPTYHVSGQNNQSHGQKFADISRRDFIRFCTAVTATLGLPIGMSKLIAQTIENPKRPPVIWLHFQECTGCTESLLRATHPTIEHLVLDLISLEYSETLSVGAGYQAEKALHDSITKNEGKFILVVEGSIPLKDNGIYCKIGNRTALNIINDIGPKAAAVVAIGSCASWGGVQSAEPNPTEATPVHQILTESPVINLPGCPASPYNLTSTLLYYLTLGKLPKLDEKSRPLFAYSTLIHENCERRPHFDAGRFVTEYGDPGHKKGWCLYKIGCKGTETFSNCPIQHFGDIGTSTWPVGAGHPCYGCSEKNIGFTKPLHEQASLFSAFPPSFYPDLSEEKTGAIGVGSAFVVGAAAGAAVGAGIKISKTLKEIDEDEISREDS